MSKYVYIHTYILLCIGGAACIISYDPAVHGMTYCNYATRLQHSVQPVDVLDRMPHPNMVECKYEQLVVSLLAVVLPSFTTGTVCRRLQISCTCLLGSILEGRP